MPTCGPFIAASGAQDGRRDDECRILRAVRRGDRHAHHGACVADCGGDGVRHDDCGADGDMADARAAVGQADYRGDEKIIEQLAFGDAIHDFDCLEPRLLEKYVQVRCNYYRPEFEKINNVTILDSLNTWEHSFDNDSYQSVVREIIAKYRVESKGFESLDSQNSLVESSI